MAGQFHDPILIITTGLVILGYLATVGFLAWLTFTRPIKRPARLVLAFGSVISTLVPIVYALHYLVV
jgi:hypothetical protein